MNDVKPKSSNSQLQSIASADRIKGVDTARGVALLGIFFVNAIFFAQPWGTILEAKVPYEEGWFSVGVFWFTSIFCAGKFYPLFSLLFGIGLAIMFESAQRRGGGFELLMLRRLFLLGLFGAAHVMLLWSGDILLIYAGIGLWMIWLGRYSAKTLTRVALIIYCVGFLFVLGFAALTNQPMPELVEKEMPVANSALEQFVEVLKDWNQSEIYDSRLSLIETQVMSEGPFYAAVAIRVFNYVFASVFILLFMFWIILPCFCLGAALTKSGFLKDKNHPWRGRLVVVGIAVGLPLSLLGAVTGLYLDQPMLIAVSLFAQFLGGPLMSLMYLVLILGWAESGYFSRPAKWFAQMGRMALTCYLLESLLMSAIVSHWGLARFGDNTWAERTLWLLAIFGLIMLFANIWMKCFSMGPLERVWRMFSYWRLRN